MGAGKDRVAMLSAAGVDRHPSIPGIRTVRPIVTFPAGDGLKAVAGFTQGWVPPAAVTGDMR